MLRLLPPDAAWVSRVLLGLGLSLSAVACGGRASIAPDEERTPGGDGDLGEDPGEEPGEDPGDDPGEEPLDCLGGQACEPGEFCLEGECVAQVCDPGTTRCSALNIESCDERGLGWSVTATCGSGQQCLEPDGEAFCFEPEQRCMPGQGECISEELLAACRPDGTGFDFVSCGADGRWCEGGSCVGAEPACEPSQLSCEDNAIAVCSEDGSSLITLQQCNDEQLCVLDPLPQCQGLVCPPGENRCEGELLFSCNETGTGYASVVDCGGNVCTTDGCKPVICNGGALSCSGGDVVLCSLNGTELSLVDDCGFGEYCAPGVGFCQPQVCVPNTISCVGNTVAQCNGTGSGFQSTTPCGDWVCQQGTCIEPVIFREDFEGDLGAWELGSSSYDATITNAVFAGGSSSVILSGSTGSHYDGLIHTFSPSVRPERVSFWARQDVVRTGTYFTLHDTFFEASPQNEVAFVFFRASGTISLGNVDSGSVVAGAYEPGTWYFFELVFDWDAKTYDFYIDGDLAVGGNVFRGAANVEGIRRVTLYHFTDSTGYWDDIVFR